MGLATNLAIQGLNKFGSKDGLTKLGDSLKNKSNDTIYTNKKPFSKYINGKPRLYGQSKTWDNSNKELLETTSFEDDDALQSWIRNNRFANQIPITFQKYGSTTIVPFVGAISGINEDIQPEWSNFRYVGNPFKTYRYQGVERSVKFNLKLYYMGIGSKQTMIKKVEYLKSLTFPDSKISEMPYAGSQTSQYAFSPNLITFSIGDLYKNMFGYMESLSFSIDDNVVWSNFNPTNLNSGDSSLYPSIMDVSIGIKIIENHSIEDGSFKYNFNGTKVFDKKVIDKKAADIVNEPAADEQKANIDVATIDQTQMSSEEIAAYYGHGL
jgi:hypothetical protein